MGPRFMHRYKPIVYSPLPCPRLLQVVPFSFFRLPFEPFESHLLLPLNNGVELAFSISFFVQIYGI